MYLTVNWPLPCSAFDRINPWSFAKGRLNLNQSPCLYSDFKVWFTSYIVHKTSRRCNENADELNRMLAVNSPVTELSNWHMLLRWTDVETTVQKEEGGKLSTIPLWDQNGHPEIIQMSKRRPKSAQYWNIKYRPLFTPCEHMIQLLFHKTSKLTFKALHSKITHWFLVIKRRKYCWSFFAFHWTVQNYFRLKRVCDF